MDIDKVSKFQRLELDRKTIHLKPGTSVLLPSDQVPPGSAIPKNGFYVELFPSDRQELGYISLNYERFIGKRKRGSIRMAVYPNFNGFISFPITISQITSPLKEHHFEYGLGMAITIEKVDNKWWSGAPFLMVPVMYRYQKTEGIFFRGGINFIVGYGDLLPHPSLSVGCKF